VAISQADKAMEYARYAEHCLKMVELIPNRHARIIHREMAAAWFQLADQAARKDTTPAARQTTTRAKRTSRG
jgi:hypothetical protein